LPDRKAFSWHFEPIVQIDERILLMTVDGYVFGKVTWIEPIPSLEVDFGALDPGELSDEREMKELYVEDNEFAQYRFVIETDNIVLVRHSCPRAVVYYATKNAYPVVPPSSSYGQIEPIKRFQLTEFYQYKDTSRYMQVQNVGTSATSEAKLAFFGYLFEFEELPGKPEKPYTVIPTVARLARRTGRART